VQISDRKFRRAVGCFPEAHHVHKMDNVKLKRICIYKVLLRQCVGEKREHLVYF